jgi:hypothetical protein
VDAGVGGGSAAPTAHLVMVYSVCGTTDSRRRSELSRTASCGSTVSRAWPTAAIVAFQRHLLGDLRADALQLAHTASCLLCITNDVHARAADHAPIIVAELGAGPRWSMSRMAISLYLRWAQRLVQ